MHSPGRPSEVRYRGEIQRDMGRGLYGSRQSQRPNFERREAAVRLHLDPSSRLATNVTDKTNRQGNCPIR